MLEPTRRLPEPLSAAPPKQRPSWVSVEGAPFPLGATWIAAEKAYNFALYSKHARSVKLLLFREEECTQPVVELPLSHLVHKSGRIWHCRVLRRDMHGAKLYAYQVDGPITRERGEYHAFDPDKVLLDPYAQSVFFPAGFERRGAMRPGRNVGKAPLGVLFEDEGPFPWGHDRRPCHESDLVIYEMHVKGFTAHPSSGVPSDHQGTYLGVIDKIPYLQQLGVTAVELMPVFQYDPQEGNYWGYMTLNFFSPHHAYAAHPRRAHQEFRQMVKALHEADIEVILDVVLNHTAEGNESGPCYSFKGIDSQTYYMMSRDPTNPYLNYSGTGNTMRCSNRYVSRMALDSLRYWVQETHVDGFRFDLASVFTRGPDGSVRYDDSPMVSAIRADPVLGGVRLIAEPWDAAGLYQLGTAFPGKRWQQWNGQFRDDVRRFVKSDAGLVPTMMRRLYGSDDLFPDDVTNSCHPFQSVNYVCSHDGFTLYDLVSYNYKRNWANGHQNTDGHDNNHSWNCGWEGDEGAPPDVLALRRRQVKNFCTLLLLANGVPMFLAGDEFLQTQGGNNNPYNQDNATTWLDWRRLETQAEIFRFFRLMIAFRQAHPSLCRSRFWRDDVRWYGTGQHVDMSPGSRRLAFHLRGAAEGDDDLYVMLNAHWEPATFVIQQANGGGWRRNIDTARSSPDDICEAGHEKPHASDRYLVGGRSIVVLVRPQPSSAG